MVFAALLLGFSFATFASAAQGAVSFAFHGQACFTIKAPGITIVTDPYADKLGFPPLHLTGDVVTVTHEHFDHNNVAAVSGSPVILKGLKPDGSVNVFDRKIKGAEIRTVATTHDSNGGKDRGNNAVFVITVGGLRVVHLGDLGEVLTAAQIKSIGRVDVLLVPVGGYFTLEPVEIGVVARALKPRIIIPMHYKTPATAKLPYGSEDEFLKLFSNVEEKGSTVNISASSLPKELTVYHMKYK